MFRNYLSTAWGDLKRSPTQSLIAIGGLAIGLVATILAAIIAIGTYSHDHFVPDYQRLYVPITEFRDSHGSQYNLNSPHDLAGYLKQFPEVDKVARVDGGMMVVSRGDNQIRQNVDYVDPGFFQLYTMTTLHGDLATALDRPDGAVINQSTARKLFGRDDVVGQTLLINHANSVTIRAVIEDAPMNMAAFPVGLFVSGLSSFSGQSFNIDKPGMTRQGGWRATMYVTLVRLKPGARLDVLNNRVAALAASFVPKNLPFTRGMYFERLDQLTVSSAVNPQTKPRLVVMWAVMSAILLLACGNFINLSIARSVQRGLEVAIRKATGAGRAALIAQFLGESVLQVLLALVLAMAFVEWCLPAVNNFLGSGATFDYWHDPVLLFGMVAGAMIIGAIAGLYPAFVLSGFRPAAVLKGVLRGGSGGRMRQAMVAFQFAVMIVFLIAAAVALQQNNFITTEARRVPTAQTLLIRMPKCSENLQDGLKRLPNVQGAACSSLSLLPEWSSAEAVRPANGGQVINLSIAPVGYGFMELYGLKPLAGRFFQPAIGDTIDETASNQDIHYVIDERAARQLGFANVRNAIGKPLNFMAANMHGTIVGVVKNFSLVPPARPELNGKVYAVGNPERVGPPPEILHVKLGGQDLPETLAAIDAEWKKSGEKDPINRQFLDSYIQSYDLATLHTGEAFAVFAAVAMLLACLGLFGISLYAASRRTKEIGVRKAMGAEDGDILRLLLWQFAKPVLIANMAAWPVAWWALSRWLSGFAYHVDLAWWLFPAASASALAIALLTVAGQVLLAAWRRPVLALRYE